jgi:signal peptidase II
LKQKVVKDYLFLFVVAGSLIALDQWTKWWVRENIEFGAQWLPQGMEWLSPYARIVHWYNSGAAFGMFQNGNMVFTTLAILVIGAILYYYPQVEAIDWTLKIAMCLQLAGASGNLIDRLMRGKVTDFISVGTFPVLNLADASISIGVAVLLLGVWMKDRSEKQKAAELQVLSEELPVDSNELPPEGPTPTANEKPKVKSE